MLEQALGASAQNQAMRKAFHSADLTGEGIVFALLDSGIALGGKYGDRVLLGTPDGAKDRTGHGTFIAGMLLESCPSAHVLSYRVLPDGYGRRTDIMAALKDVLRLAKLSGTAAGESAEQTDEPIAVRADGTKVSLRGMKFIVNCSFMGPSSSDEQDKAYQAVFDALVDAGIPVICAAGNDGREAVGENTKFPGCFQSPICVSAVEDSFVRAPFSTWHSQMDFVDLGVDIQSIGLDGERTTRSGTSFACPNVAWKAGLLCCLYKRELGKWPDEQEIFAMLQDCAQDLGEKSKDSYYGYGFVCIQYNNQEEEANLRATLKYTEPYMRGDDVRYAQTRLLLHGFDPQGVDGIFGIKTDTAVRAFQAAKGLLSDGIIGESTWAALELEPKEGDTGGETRAASAEGLVRFCYEKLGDLYVWGGRGQTAITEAWIRAMDTSDAQAARSIASWKAKIAAGLTNIAAYDCSGLISHYLINQGILSSKRNSDGLWAMCKAISKAELVRGDLLFRSDGKNDMYHVGVYVGRGRVIEAKGRDEGVILSLIDAKRGYWDKYGRLRVLS